MDRLYFALHSSVLSHKFASLDARQSCIAVPSLFEVTGREHSRARQLAPLILSDAKRAELKALARHRKTAQALARRARIVLACAEGCQNKEVAAKLGAAEMTVGKWRRRFVQERLEGLRDEPRPGAPRKVDDARCAHRSHHRKGPWRAFQKVATHWSSCGMARESGLSVSSVQRIWRAFGLQPHRMETFKLSTAPDLWPTCAMWSASTSPRPSMPSSCVWTRSLKSNRPQPADATNAPRSTRPAQPRLHPPRHDIAFRGARHCDGQRQRQTLFPSPRCRVPQVHLTPISSSRFNQVERFFALITTKRSGASLYRSIRPLRADIIDFIRHYNADPKPQTKSADDILAPIKRFCRYNTQAQTT